MNRRHAMQGIAMLAAARCMPLPGLERAVMESTPIGPLSFRRPRGRHGTYPLLTIENGAERVLHFGNFESREAYIQHLRRQP